VKTFYSARHSGHGDRVELLSGKLVPAFEVPQRAEIVREAVEDAKLGPILPPQPQSLATAQRIHLPRYLEFLSQAWAEWTAAGHTNACMPAYWRAPGMADASQPEKEPRTIEGRLGFWSFDTSSSIVAGTWDAVLSSYEVALTAAEAVLAGEPSAFALCRPPGHHAGSCFMGGYCFINNAAAAAERFRERGAVRVAVLDVDYHHGNGTQEIFYNRADVMVVNIHADPRDEYPYFLGFAGETGGATGEGFNVNYPLPLGTDFAAYEAALRGAIARITAFKPDAVVVSLGVDTFEKDPISQFRLITADYPRMGRMIARLPGPVLFVMEGGYAVADAGRNVLGVLQGFEGGYRRSAV
jgi:acetoin utilization deacetylase AcuC-like enzyme